MGEGENKLTAYLKIGHKCIFDAKMSIFVGLGRICFFAGCRISGRIFRHALSGIAGYPAFSCQITDYSAG